MAKTLIQHRWRYFDEVRGKNVTTRYLCTEEHIRKEHPDATPVPGTEQVRELSEDLLANSTGRFYSGFSKGD
jgi:hypothetical protein